MQCKFVTWVYLIAVITLLVGCERSQRSDAANELDEAVSGDLVWSFMISESSAIAQIRKWDQPALRGLMIIDKSRAEFYGQFSPLLGQVGDAIGLKINACEAVVDAEGVLASSEADCEGKSFDFHFVVTDGAWTDSEWHDAQDVLDDKAGGLLTNLRNEVAAAPGGEEHTCRVAFSYSPRVSTRIERALVLIDSREPVVLGKCGTYLFLNMLGLYPFDGTQPLEPGKEAQSLAKFLLKQTPYGGTYLLRLLYSPKVKPGMSKAEFARALSK